jgi:CubicO group peptidase (beta-lactamase class C family)
LKKLLKYIYVLGFALLTMLPQSCNDAQSKRKQPLFQADKIITDLDQKIIARKAHIIDSIFSRLHKRNLFNGCVMYAEKGRLVFEGAYGYSDIRHKEELTVNSAFQLASVSKMFTAMAIMILKERGKLDYDDLVIKYIPELPYTDVTIRELLTHRSGLPRYMSLADHEWPDKKIPINNEDVIALLVKYHPSPYFSPDNGFHYCNTNYALLASVVERISGETFDRFMAENIFKPLKMDHSFIYNMNGDTTVPFYIPVGVPGHRYRRWRPVKEPNDYLNGVMGDKGVYTTVDDMFKWDQSLWDHTLVSDSTLEEAFSPGSPKYWKRNKNYGFGWRIKENRPDAVYHFGWWKGFRSYFIRDLKQEKSIVVLTNVDRGPSSTIYWKIIDDDRYELGYIDKISDREERSEEN